MPTGEGLDALLKISYVAVPLLATFVGWAVGRHIRLSYLQAEHEKLLREKESIEGKLEETRRNAEESRQAFAERYDRSRADYQKAHAKFYELKAAAFRVKKELDELKASSVPGAPVIEQPETTQVAIDELEAQLATARQELEEARSRIEEATRTDGRIWLRPPTGNVPVFRPHDHRQCTIISVLNLKGGVGKTTITANLAATMATKDSPALLVDLDFQRSLSMLLLDNKDRVLLHRAGFTVQHFLSGDCHSSSQLLSRLKDLAPDHPACSILTNSDSRAGSHGADGLEETETRLMIDWLFDRNRPDPRYFLREALHERAVGDAFRYVFLDCPPRLTTACINALAASDYVLIPIVPDVVSTRAAENLLTTLQGLRSVVCPDLRVLALVPNMVKIVKDKPMKAHADALAALRIPLRERWHESIRVAESCIRHDSAFGLAAAELDTGDKLSLAISDVAVADCFKNLAKELLQEMQHHESRRPSAIPA